nr:MAG TPA: hypothetical protein [Caudoviricetes sp.]
MRSATIAAVKSDFEAVVSIHALLAECDNMNYIVVEDNAGFNPRTPCGVRQRVIPLAPMSIKFQSTHSLRSATEKF